MSWNCKEIDRELFEIEMEHFESCGEASRLAVILLSNHVIFKRSILGLLILLLLRLSIMVLGTDVKIVW